MVRHCPGAQVRLASFLVTLHQYVDVPFKDESPEESGHVRNYVVPLSATVGGVRARRPLC